MRTRYSLEAHFDVTLKDVTSRLTGRQELTLQRDALTAAGVNPDLIFAEKITGTKRDGREKLDLLLKFVEKGDAIVITRIDRLACTTCRTFRPQRRGVAEPNSARGRRSRNA